MGVKMGLLGITISSVYAMIPVSKTYYSDHVYVKYIPWFIFADDESQKEEYLKNVEYTKKDMYPRELYSRNYHRLWFLKKKALCVVGDRIC